MSYNNNYNDNLAIQDNDEYNYQEKHDEKRLKKERKKFI